MYKRILVPTDGSERSVKAVEGAPASPGRSVPRSS